MKTNIDPTQEESPALLAPQAKRKPTREEVWNGTVSAIGPDWFELAAGWEGGRDRATGEPGWDVTLSEKPKRLTTWGTVVGGDPGGERAMLGDGITHMFSDLKVGDRVRVWCHGDEREEWSVGIEILRRPGDKIPPMPVDRFGVQSEIPAENQAEQDWEEYGLPLVTRLLTGGQVTPSYPPVAPQPREVKP